MVGAGRPRLGPVSRPQRATPAKALDKCAMRRLAHATGAMSAAAASPSPPNPALQQRLAQLALDQRAAATSPQAPCCAWHRPARARPRPWWRASLGVSPPGADPATICALTFNRRAADELQVRADDALAELGHGAGSVRVRTFHALGREILADAGIDVSHIVERASVLRTGRWRAAHADGPARARRRVHPAQARPCTWSGAQEPTSRSRPPRR